MRIIICFGDRTRSGTFFTENINKVKVQHFSAWQVCHCLLTLTDNQFPSTFRFIRYFNVNWGLEIKKSAFSVESLYHKDSTTTRPIKNVKPCPEGIVLGWVTKYEYPVL